MGGALRAIVTTREAGSGGRVELQHDLIMRTNNVDADVKSCGPGLPVLRSAECAERALSQTGAIEPVPEEITYKR